MSHFKAKMHQIRFQLGLRPKPTGGASSSSLLYVETVEASTSTPATLQYHAKQHVMPWLEISQRWLIDKSIRGFFNEMRYINLRFTYLLTYLLTKSHALPSTPQTP